MSHQKKQVAESMHIPHDQLPPRYPQSPQQQLEAARLPQLPCSSLLGLGPSKRFGSQLVPTFYGKHPEGLALFTPPFFFFSGASLVSVPSRPHYRGERLLRGLLAVGSAAIWDGLRFDNCVFRVSPDSLWEQLRGEKVGACLIP